MEIISHPMKDDSYRLNGEYGVAIDKNSVKESVKPEEE